MAVVSSGEIKLNGDVNIEINGSLGTDVSLSALSTGAGFSEPHGLFEFYGYVDAIAPSVSTGNASSITTSSMTISGNVTSDGGGTITERGFYFGTNSSNATSNTKYIVSGTTGSYSRNMTGLSSSTTYYWWAYATNSVGTTIASRKQAGTATPQVPYTMQPFYSWGTVPKIAGDYTAGFYSADYSQWGSPDQTKLNPEVNNLGTTINGGVFINGGYGFYLQSSSYFSAAISSTFGFYTSSTWGVYNNGYFNGPLSFNPHTYGDYVNIVPAGYIGRIYYQLTASGYAARSVEVARQPFT